MNHQTERQLLNLVQKNYATIAPEFAATRQNLNWPELKKFTDTVEDGSTVLDVGCGSGRLFSLLENKNIKYLGLDNCAPLIAIAREQYKTDNAEFMVGDILKLNLIKPINFNYIFCVAVLHHLPGKNLRLQALKQLKNKLNDNGKIIITVWNLWQAKYRSRIFKFMFLKWLGKNKMDFGDILFDWKASGGQGNQRYYHAFTERELKRLARQAGLKIESLSKDKHNYYLVLKK